MLGFAAVNTGNNLLFLVVSGLLAFMSVTGYVGMVNLQGLQVELIPPAAVYAGQPASFILRVSNTKRYFSSFLLLYASGGQSVALGCLRPAASRDLPLRLIFEERGRAALDAVRVSSPFPVNFFVRSCRLHVGCALLVYPRLQPCSAWGIADGGRHRAEGRREAREGEGEVEQILDYTGREPLRQIHWKLSARSDALQVKQYQGSASNPLMIDLAQLPGNLEERISRAAWVVNHWTPVRPVGLRLGGTVLPPLAGQRQRYHLLKALALFGRMDQSDLKGAISSSS